MDFLNDSRTKRKVLKTEKYWIHTDEGKILDILCGNTAFIFGYNNEYVLKRMFDLQSRIGFLKDSANETCDELNSLISKIFEISKMEGLCWAVSGSDGVECSIYANDQYWKVLNKDKSLIITFDPCYHGATYLARIFRKEYNSTHRVVTVPLPQWDRIRDRELAEKECLEKIESLLSSNEKIGAILIESCPWVGGLRPWSESCWKSIKKLCDNYNINFIVDDTLGGVGKQGFYFSHQRYQVLPDIVSIGKSFTAGYSPLSVSCFSKKINDVVKNSWDFSHTWNPNLAGIGAALAVLEKFNTDDILKIEKRLYSIFNKMQSDQLISDFVVQGLMSQIELIGSYDSEVLYKHGLNGNLKKSKSIFICVPAIADDEYFFEFEQRLTKALNDKI